MKTYNWLIIGAVALILTGCGTAPQPVDVPQVTVQKVEIAKSYVTHIDYPDVPPVNFTQRDIAAYILRDRGAIDACNARLDDIWMSYGPKTQQ